MSANTNVKGALYSITAFAFLSCTDALIKSLGGQYTVYQILFFSTLFTLVPLTMFIISDRETTSFRPRNPVLITIRTACVIIAFFGVYTAFTTLPLAEVYAMLFAAPLIITALSGPILKEHVGVARWGAVITGLIGVLIVLRPGLSPLGIGHLAATGAAIFFSFSALIVRRIGKEERSATLLLLPYLGLVIVAGILMRPEFKPVTLPHLTTLMFVGLFSVCGQLCTILAFRAATAAVVAPMQYTQIFWAALFGIVFFNERPDIWVWVGTVIIITSGLFILFRERRVATPKI